MTMLAPCFCSIVALKMSSRNYLQVSWRSSGLIKVVLLLPPKHREVSCKSLKCRFVKLKRAKVSKNVNVDKKIASVEFENGNVSSKLLVSSLRRFKLVFQKGSTFTVVCKGSLWTCRGE